MPKRKPNMKTQLMKLIFSTVAMLTLVVGGATSAKAQDPLPSWNDGPAKQAILAFVKEVTDNKSNPKYVAPEDRIATFDQDGTLWVEHPMYTQVMYCLERAVAGRKETGTQEHRAVQECPLRQPGGNGETPDEGP